METLKLPEQLYRKQTTIPMVTGKTISKKECSQSSAAGFITQGDEELVATCSNMKGFAGSESAHNNALYDDADKSERSVVTENHQSRSDREKLICFDLTSSNCNRASSSTPDVSSVLSKKDPI